MNKNLLLLAAAMALTSAASAQTKAGGISQAMLDEIRNGRQATAADRAIANAIAANPIDKLAQNHANAGAIDTHFSIETPAQSITDQQQSGRCWMFSGMNVLRAAFAKRTDSLRVDFSQAYLFFYDQLEKANLFLQGVVETADKPMDDTRVQFFFKNPINDGGTFCGVADLADKYGLVPKEVMPETYSSDNTSQMARLVATKLREYGLDLRQMVADGKAAKDIEAEKTRMLATIYRMLALTIGLTTGLTMCITLVMAGLKSAYGMQETVPLFIILGVIIIFCFTFSTYVGLDKGLKIVGNFNAWFYYGLLALLLVTGPTLFIARMGTAGVGEWLTNFWRWGLDPIDVGGPALTRAWTLWDFCFMIGYAPVTGIFLAILSYGRTVREYLIVNWVLPAVFGIIWFAIWGASAIDMQINGTADLVGAIKTGGAVMALWEFLKNLPFGLGVVVIPINIVVILVSFITCADATLVNIGSMCVRDVPIGTEPPAKIKVLWGVTVGAIAIVMAAYGGGAQGIDGVKALASAAGFVVLFIYAIQAVAYVKVFFVDKVDE